MIADDPALPPIDQLANGPTPKDFFIFRALFAAGFCDKNIKGRDIAAMQQRSFSNVAPRLVAFLERRRDRARTIPHEFPKRKKEA
jgi:hypothetical protein